MKFPSTYPPLQICLVDCFNTVAFSNILKSRKNYNKNFRHSNITDLHHSVWISEVFQHLFDFI